MSVTIIYACDSNNLIGLNGVLPWYNKKDLEFFSKVTKDSIVIMGRKTFDSLPVDYKPLPNRINVVLTKNTESIYGFDKISKNLCYVSWEWLKRNMLIDSQTENIFVIGGKEIFDKFLEEDMVDYIIKSEVPKTVNFGGLDTPTYFTFDETKWDSLGECCVKLGYDGPFIEMFKRYEKCDIESHVENVLLEMMKR